jgi:hypothetical protein
MNMRTLYRITNIVLIIGIVACCAGALAGMIVLLPFVVGAWLLNLMALLGDAESERREPRAAEAATAPVKDRVPVTSVEARGSMPVTHGIS